MVKKTANFFFVLALLFGLVFSNSVYALDIDGEDNNIEIVDDTKDFKKKINDNKDILGNITKLDTTEILKELKPKNVVTVNSDNIDFFGVINIDNEKVPVYISSEDKDLKSVKKAFKTLKKLYKDKIENEKKVKANSIVSILSTEPNFSKVGDTLKLSVSSGGDKFWYSEYRCYKDPDFSSVEDIFWLRADHQPYPSTQPIFQFNASWDANADIIDPKPTTQNNVSTSISWSIPPSISMSTTLSAEDSDDVSLTTNISSDIATWTVNNKMWSGVHQNMDNFNFTHGFQIEAPKSKNGFNVVVDYSRMDGLYSTKDWTDEIIFVESSDDLDFND